jgi:hypothetical protein
VIRLYATPGVVMVVATNLPLEEILAVADGLRLGT